MTRIFSWRLNIRTFAIIAVVLVTYAGFAWATDCKKGCKELTLQSWSGGSGSENCRKFSSPGHCTMSDYDQADGADDNGTCAAKSPKDTFRVQKCTCDNLCNGAGTNEMKNDSSCTDSVTADRADCITGSK